jgi:hypothetical protein
MRLCATSSAGCGTRGLLRRTLLAVAMASLGWAPLAVAARHPGPWPRPVPHPRPLVLAEYHVWHGLPSHSAAFAGATWLPAQRAYDSRDPAIIAAHIADAKRRGIAGFVVNWYGQRAGVANDEDRAFMDQATRTLLRMAEAMRFKVALIYDEGTVSLAETQPGRYQARVVRDLRYARHTYFASPAYLRLRGRPALFVFPYSDVDPSIDWARVRTALRRRVTLIGKGPNPETPLRDREWDGFYAWVGPSAAGWDPDGMEWGEGYLHWFYDTMRSPAYRRKLTVGGVWPGFDDSLAPWGSHRFMSRQGTFVYDETWRMAHDAGAPVIMVATYNDMEEGTDIEQGVEMDVDMEATQPEILLRSTPLRVTWDGARGDLPLQVYRDGELIFDETCPAGTYLSLESGQAYEIKVWLPSGTPLARTVKIRREDPVPGVDPIGVE